MSIVLALLLAFALVLSACTQEGDTEPAATDDTAVDTPAGDDGENPPAEGGLTGEITVQAEEGWMEYYQAAVSSEERRVGEESRSRLSPEH